ncbi:DUF697 domain-containing protein [Nannocystis pusilla]|uniref:DUF697 domain-containing protein n=2 Tax=Nannocystis pusilla TaxID=889268 RepID=A0A9X3F0S1_9BACT|nr:DUF697 domain-containing protein [Nannocystis pusilla]
MRDRENDATTLTLGLKRSEVLSMVSETTQVKEVAHDPETRLMQADAIIHRNVLWALGAGVVPIPIADVLAVSAVQVKQLKELSALYGIAFREDLAKKLVGSLLVGIGGVGVGAALGMSLAKLIPVVGTALGIVSVPVASGAFTHAIGRVFVMHFESGGTFLDFDPHRMRDHFRREFEGAKEKVAELRNRPGAPNVSPQGPA